MNAAGWSRGLEVTGGGTGIVSHAGRLLRQLAGRAGLTDGLPAALPSPLGGHGPPPETRAPSHDCCPAGAPASPSAPTASASLRQIGIRSGPARSAALFQLATELPAAILARTLGIHIDIAVAVAVAWQRISAGDWMTYAAGISRRPPQEQPSPSPGRPLETETS